MPKLLKILFISSLITLFLFMAAGPSHSANKVRWKRAIASAFSEPQPLACNNMHMNNRLMGVASRRFPCNTKLTLKYRGIQVHVKVLDWGPAAWTGRSLDLMPAVFHKFGFRTQDGWGERVVLWQKGWK